MEKNDLKLISKKDEMITKYMEELVKLNSNPEFREYMSVEEDERKINNSLLQSSYNDGKTEGIKEGFEKGKENEKTDLAKRFLNKNVDINIISKVTGLSVEKLNELSR